MAAGPWLLLADRGVLVAEDDLTHFFAVSAQMGVGVDVFPARIVGIDVMAHLCQRLWLEVLCSPGECQAGRV